MQIKQKSIANTALGFSVAVLYLIFICLVFAGFSGYITRVNLGNELAAEVGSIDTLIFRGTRESEVRQSLDATRAGISKLQDSVQNAVLRRTQSELDHFYQRSRLLELFVPISTTINSNKSILDREFVARFLAIYVNDELSHDEKANRLSLVLSTINFSENASPENREALSSQVQQVLSALSERQSQLSEVVVTMEKASLEQSVLEREISALKEVASRFESELSAMRGKLTDEHRALLASFKNSLGGIPYSLIQIPTIILTLTVTIAAGGLGSTVAFTRKFLRGYKDTGPGRLFVNVGEGVAAALAIFLLGGAGMLMLAQGAAGAEGQVELSPYMVAFVAFVSGFMAEQAFYRIHVAGANLFQAQGQDVETPEPAQPTGDVKASIPGDTGAQNQGPKHKESPGDAT